VAILNIPLSFNDDICVFFEQTVNFLRCRHLLTLQYTTLRLINNTLEQLPVMPDRKFLFCFQRVLRLWTGTSYRLREFSVSRSSNQGIGIRRSIRCLSNRFIYRERGLSVELSGASGDPLQSYKTSYGEGLKKLQGDRKGFERHFELTQRAQTVGLLSISPHLIDRPLPKAQNRWR
jgi:hypothetical protein